MGTNKLVIGSIIGNVLLVVVLILFIVFGRTKPIEEYDAEIATLTTINIGLEEKNEELSGIKDGYDEDIAKYDEDLTKVSKELLISNAEIKRLNGLRDGIPNFVGELPNDSVAGEFTRYLQRRTKRGTP